jgi:hypothetical protein
VYSFALEPNYLAQFGFEPVPTERLDDPMADRLETKREAMTDDIVAMRLSVDEFSMPERFREAFKFAMPAEEATEPEERPEDFGIDPDSATYKYDTGR